MKFFKFTVGFLYAIAGFWLAFAVYWLFQGTDYRWFYVTAAVGNAIVLALLTYLMSRGRPWAYWFLVALMAFNVLVVIFDQIGWFDLIYLVPALAALGMAVGVRRTMI